MSSSSSSSFSSESSESTGEIEDKTEPTGRPEQIEPIYNNEQYRPSIDFVVSHLGNKSVQFLITGSERAYVIWFNDDAYNATVDVKRSSAKVQNILDNGYKVHCLVTESNPIFINGLEENIAYTFCVIPYGDKEISPFNCAPVRVPGLDRHLTKWIGNENKHFTITMIILSFACSMVFGSVISYFTIKTYPDLM